MWVWPQVLVGGTSPKEPRGSGEGGGGWGGKGCGSREGSFSGMGGDRQSALGARPTSGGSRCMKC